MKRLDRTFRMLRRARRPALVAFCMAGDPTLAGSERLARVLIEAGADILELGLPFSDPLADGPTIQAAAQRALLSGTTAPQVLGLVHRLRRRYDCPIVVLSYLNPVITFGGHPPAARPVAEACMPFLRAAEHAGLDGVVIPDLPVNEGRALGVLAAQYGVALIPLAAPTSTAARLRAIGQSARGFVYYVSVTGTTGARQRLPSTVADGVRRLRRATALPICVGFGVSTPADAHRIANVADGVIVGSAIVQRWAATKSTTAVARYVHSLRRALDRT